MLIEFDENCINKQFKNFDKTKHRLKRLGIPEKNDIYMTDSGAIKCKDEIFDDNYIFFIVEEVKPKRKILELVRKNE